MRICSNAACDTVLVEADGFRVIPNADDAEQFSIEIELSTARIPVETFHLEVTSYSVKATFAFTLLVKDCSVQTVTLVGDAAATITRELGKNNGLVTLFEIATTTGWFEVSDTRAECAITGYLLYHTASEELTETNNAALWARLDGANYGENGLVKIDTDITAAETTIQDFFIAATAPLIANTVTPAI